MLLKPFVKGFLKPNKIIIIQMVEINIKCRRTKFSDWRVGHGVQT